MIDWLEATESIAAVAKGLRLSWDEVSGIRGRAVARGMKRRGRAPLPASVVVGGRFAVCGRREKRHGVISAYRNPQTAYFFMRS